jgi:hypothetical protein
MTKSRRVTGGRLEVMARRPVWRWVLMALRLVCRLVGRTIELGIEVAI